LQNETLSQPLHNNIKKRTKFQKSSKSVSAYCLVVRSSSKSWYKTY